MPKFPATVGMAAEGGLSLRRVCIVNRQLWRALVAQRVAGRWSLRFWYCESAAQAQALALALGLALRRWGYHWAWRWGAGIGAGVVVSVVIPCSYINIEE